MGVCCIVSVSRLKTLFIAALLLINAFFLTIIIADRYDDARNERQAIENLCAILMSNGIAIDPDSIKPAGELRAMRTARDVETEAAIANAFLEQVEMTGQGVIYLYDNAERGMAKFYSACDFEIQLNEGVIISDDNTLKTVRQLLRDMKIEASMLTVSIEPDSEIVTVVNTYRDAGIFNGSIDFIFEGGSLRTVIGRYVTGVELLGEGTVISHAGTALLEFLAAVKRGDIECESILSVEAGYLQSVVGPFGEGIIAPVWLITTGAGQYTVDSATGEIRPL